MDISTGLGLGFGCIVLVTLIMMGGDLKMFVDLHAFIVIFGGATAATLIRFPLSCIFHGLPMGMKFAFTMRRWTPRELVDEIANLAEIARKQGPIGLEKVEIEDTFLAKGMRYVADLSVPEIAECLDLSVANVHQICSRSLRRLRSTVTGATQDTGPHLRAVSDSE